MVWLRIPEGLKTWKFPGYEIGESLDWARMEADLDWLRAMDGVPQDSIWHAEGDVLTHTRMVVEELLADAGFEALEPVLKHAMVAAALLHDVEKRSTTTTEVLDGVERIVSPRHAKKGEFTARSWLYKDCPTPFHLREQIAKLVRLHGLPLWAIGRDDPRKEVIRASLVVDSALLAMLAKADVRGRICEDQEEVLFRIDLFEELCREHGCWGKARKFASDLGRYWFLNRSEVSPDLKPYDDLAFEVTMLCGLPGAGKDTYIQQHLDQPVLSLDDIRRAQRIDPTDKKGNGRVVQMGKEQAREWMRRKQSFVFNATNLTRDMRSRWSSLFVEYGARLRMVYVEVPFQQLLFQNKNRPHPVPGEVLDRLIGKLEIPHPEEAHEVVYAVKG